MTDHESAQINALRQTIEGYRDEVKRALDFIDGVGGIEGARVRLALAEQQLAATVEAAKKREDDDNRNQGIRISWWQGVLFLFAPPFLLALIQHYWH